MKPDARIPIVIGVSGHRQLPDAGIAALEAAVTAQLQLLQSSCPHSPLVMLNSLAEGADQLAARVALRLSIPYIALLPMEADEYRQDFSGDALTEFDALLNKALRTIVVPQIEAPPTDPDHDYFYRQAGVYIAMHSHILFALWDGTPPVPGGCGTAEVVDMVLNGCYAPAHGNILRSEEDGAVLHIFTPRGDMAGIAGQTTFLGHQDSYQRILKKTDTFNRRAAAFSGRMQAMPGASGGDETTVRLDAAYQKADGLSCRAAQNYLRILALLAVAGVIVTLGFLLYGELEMHWMLLICGLMLIVAGGAYRYAGKSDAHGQYIEYRALAETLRVQAYLRLSGTDVSAASLMTWTQRTETLWIKEAIAAMNIAPPSNGHSDVRDCWIREQRDYHRRAGERTHAQLKKNELIMRAALILSVTAYGVALLFELLCGDILPPTLPQAPQTVQLFRTVIKLIVGVLSASTLFVANYYGKLSLKRKVSDHAKMALLYDEALAHQDANGRSEALIIELAREELVENGNWCSYQRDNQPDISL